MFPSAEAPVLDEPGAGADRPALTGWVVARLGSVNEARWMLDEVLGRPGPSGGRGVAVDEAHRERLRQLVARRTAGEPLQYVLGRWAFRYLELEVDPRVLIPRPETEQIVELALAELAQLAPVAGGPRVVDLGTGSGAIALSLASEAGRRYGGLEVWAVDADPAALAVARSNLERVAAIDPAAAGRVHLAEGSWWDALPERLRGRIDLVVSNPPYVAVEEWPDLPADVRREPRGALVSAAASDGTPGLADVEAVLTGAVAWLRRPGAAVVELAPHQASASVEMARALGFVDASVLPDLTGRPRGLVARW